MRSLRSHAGTWLYRMAARAPLVVPPEWSPVFLIGCGRSGTTITTRVLGSIPEILALNEPRHMWRAVSPRTDIWSAAPEGRSAQLGFARHDADPHTCLRCRRIFFARYLSSRRSLLVEKLPLNSFRHEWIDAIFPTAKYVQLVRNGLDVAHSVALTGPGWYGRNHRKWSALIAWARQHGYDAPLLEADLTPAEQGLVEWTLSVDASQQFFAGCDPARWLTIRYEQLVADPVETFHRVLEFLQLRPSASVVRQKCAAIRRPSGRKFRPAAPARRLERTDQLLEALGYGADHVTSMATS